MQQSVVLLHGLGANRWTMSRLSTRLRKSGYATHNWGYRSWVGSIELHAEQFRTRFLQLADRERGTTHVVGHSMGSIVARRAFLDGVPDHLGKLVMLGPPNFGSHVARKLTSTLGLICPAIRELSDEPTSYVNELGVESNIPTGVIAAELDRVVKLSSTVLPIQTDHIVLPGHHGVLPWRKDTADQVAHFLKNGHFVRVESASHFMQQNGAEVRTESRTSLA